MSNAKEIYSQLLERLGANVPDGYFFSPTYRHYQKVQNQIYVYVTPELGHSWKVQAYIRGTAEMCSLEARIYMNSNELPTLYSPDEILERYGQNISKLFELAEIWLDRYGDDSEAMKADVFNPFHIKGWEGRDISNKKLQYN
ncbi:hypothetical protein CON36_35415 [Bacillus cereus]|uniref:Uncharacterized protein n=2 Tax=Bacillus cereus group TaxID=86661 RepID=A0A9X6SSN9_BACCE|nr:MULTISPECIES: hypothetical protein [Bacillus cereus group]PDZ94133.1 hypothetical protein CON36_35415 [Bacillus cereus]PFJ25589.1 hypothetical protein COJ15_35615 [Bacillus thuringiensis]PGP12011.1 hypothetical protein COA01_34900 [Bacillus cereus]